MAEHLVKENFDTDLLGSYQLKNVITTVQCVRLLNQTDFEIKNKHLVNGLLSVVQKTKSKQVMIKFDRSKKDKDNDWIGYLYLKNKTFLNAHLIKLGFAEADTKSDHKYLKRFLAYQYKSKEL